MLIKFALLMLCLMWYCWLLYCRPKKPTWWDDIKTCEAHYQTHGYYISPDKVSLQAYYDYINHRCKVDKLYD